MGFSRFASIARLAGTPWTSGIALAFILTWAMCGSLFDFSESSQLVVNTGTTIVIFARLAEKAREGSRSVEELQRHAKAGS